VRETSAFTTTHLCTCRVRDTSQRFTVVWYTQPHREKIAVFRYLRIMCLMKDVCCSLVNAIFASENYSGIMLPLIKSNRQALHAYSVIKTVFRRYVSWRVSQTDKQSCCCGVNAAFQLSHKWFGHCWTNSHVMIGLHASQLQFWRSAPVCIPIFCLQLMFLFFTCELAFIVSAEILVNIWSIA